MAGPFDDLIPAQRSGGFQAPPIRQVVPPQPKQFTPQSPDQAALTRAQTDAARLSAQQTARELAIPNLSPGQKAVDEAFGKDYVDWKAQGGFADAQKQLIQLRTAHQRLKGKENLSGGYIGIAPEWMLKLGINPAAVDVKDLVHDSAQRALRQVLGAQFTEAEGTRLLQKAYDTGQPEQVNRNRVARLFNQLAAAAKAKESASRYFEKKGTLAGWKGKIWSLNDFDPDSDKSNPGAGQGPRRINSDADYDRLPSGATFIAPDGSTRRKP